MSQTVPFGDPAEPDREASRGLTDPRTIPPAPEDIFPEGAESSEGGPDPMPPVDEPAREDEVRGIVDPRSEPAGPDL